MPPKPSSTLIIGAGTFGLSTAYHLAKAGYPNITLLEKGLTIPSPLSAANDLNKIIRAEYEDPFYTDLALASIAEWTTNPLFALHYRQVGYLLGNSAGAPEKSKISLAKALASIEQHPSFKDQITAINTRDDIRRIAPALDGPMDGWTGYFNRLAGYAHSANALRAVREAVKDMGVDIRLGEGVISVKYDGTGRRCTGAVTSSGEVYSADVTILTMGASIGNILPEIGRQVTAKSWAVAHVQLTEEEAGRLEGIPVTYARDLGFFFEPDRETGLLKVSTAGAGYTNYGGGERGDDGVRISVPPEENNFMPGGEEEAVRKVLREHLPFLAERPLVECKICWCADTADSNYIIDRVPGKEGVVVVAGDSGHAFKMMPLVGGWVKDLLEGHGQQRVGRWRWKESSINVDGCGSGHGRVGDQVVSWRVGTTRDLSEVVKMSGE